MTLTFFAYATFSKDIRKWEAEEPGKRDALGKENFLYACLFACCWFCCCDKTNAAFLDYKNSEKFKEFKSRQAAARE